MTVAVTHEAERQTVRECQRNRAAITVVAAAVEGLECWHN